MGEPDHRATAGRGCQTAPSAVLGAEGMTSKGMGVNMPLLVRDVEVLAAL
jgi:hypothetical protein